MYCLGRILRRAGQICPAVALLTIVSIPRTASAVVSTYEMTVGPDAEALPMTKEGDGYGDAAAGNLGPPLNAGLQGDGTARFVDTGNNGNDGFYVNGLGTTFTVDMRIKSNVAAVSGSGGSRSMNISDGVNGRGIRIETSGLTFQDGNNPIGTAAVNLSTMHMVRIVVTGGNASVYDLENDTDPTANISWQLLAGPIALGGAGWANAEFTGFGGGVSLNSLSGGVTTGSDYVVDFLRVDTGADRGAVQDLIPGPVVTCAAGVAPGTTQTLAGFENGISPTPPPVNYTFTNLSPNPINGYSVTEVTGLGAATDYPWLSLVGASGNIGGNSNVIVTANVSTTGLVAGSYTGYLKFNDTCPALPPTLTINFDNPPYTQTGGTGGTNALVGQDAWTGSAANTAIRIDATSGVGGTGNVHVFEGTGGFDAQKTLSCAADGDGLLSVKFKAKAGSAGDGSNFWLVWVYDDNTSLNGGLGGTIGRWQGGSNRVSGQNGSGQAVPDVTLTASYVELEMRYYTASHQLEFFHNGISDGVLNAFNAAGVFQANNKIGRIRIERINRVLAGDNVLLDDLSASVLERHMRRIDLTVTGCDLTVLDPQWLTLGPCPNTPGNTTTHTFTIKNNGAYAWADYYGFIYNTAPWLVSVSPSTPGSGGPIPRGGTATITVTVDWTQVSSSPDLLGGVGFRSSCDGVNYIETKPDNPNNATSDNIRVRLNVVPPQVVHYEGDVAPLDPNSGGPGISFVLLGEAGNTDQGTVVSDLGVDGAIDGLAYHVVDSAASKTKLKVTPAPSIDAAAGMTIVSRVKTISGSGTAGGNLFIFADPISAEAHWDGPGGLLVDTEHGVSVPFPSDNKYHVVRLTSKDTQGPNGRVIRIYVDENPVPALEILNAAASTTHAADVGIGFGAGSTAGQQEIFFDCVYGTNGGAFAPGQEVDCLGTSLVCVPNCNHPFADVDPAPSGDGDVDMNDYAIFQRCYTGSNFVGSLAPECKCFDRNTAGPSANSIDVGDFLKFVACESGTGVPWQSSVDCP